MNKLKLSVRAVRAIQNKHGIANIFALDKEPEKITVDFLADMYFEGSRSWDPAPSLDQVEDLELEELMAAVKNALSGDAGKPTAG
jgi:hypothetical protein